MTHDAPNLDLAPRSVPLHLLALAGPMIAAMVSRTAMNFVDFVMVSELGTAAQAAITPAAIMVFCVISFGMGTMAAVNTFVAQSFGRRRLDDCSNYTWQGLYLGLAIGVIVLPAWWLLEPAFAWMNHAPDVQQMESAYAKVALLTVGPTIATIAVASFFNGIHRPMVQTVATIVSNAANVLFNYALIFGKLGMPELGIAGAAWGTCAAVVLQLAIMAVWYVTPHYRRRYRTLSTWRPAPAYIWRLIKVGAPIGGQMTIDLVVWTLFIVWLVGGFGKEQLAATNISFRLLELSYMPAIGISRALSAAVGKSLGARRVDLARAYVRWGLLFTVGYMTLLGLVFAGLRYPLVRLFTNDPAVIQWAVAMMLFCAVFQVFDALSISLGGVLQGAGDTTWPACILVLYSTTIFLGGGWLMTRMMPQWQSLGPWLTATIYIAAMGITLAWRYRHGHWETIDLHGEHES